MHQNSSTIQLRSQATSKRFREGKEKYVLTWIFMLSSELQFLWYNLREAYASQVLYILHITKYYIFPVLPQVLHIPSTTTTLLLRMYSLRALALSGEVIRTTHSLSFAGRCDIIDQLFFRRVFFNLRHGLSPKRGTNCSLAYIKRL